MSAAVRMSRQRRPARPLHTGTGITAGAELASRLALGQYRKLMEADASVQEVYLYGWLQFAGALRRKNPFMTHTSEMRFGAPVFEGGNVEIYPCRLAPNTITATLESLEEKGLIVVERITKGRKIELSIYLPE